MFSKESETPPEAPAGPKPDDVEEGAAAGRGEKLSGWEELKLDLIATAVSARQLFENLVLMIRASFLEQCVDRSIVSAP